MTVTKYLDSLQWVKTLDSSKYRGSEKINQTDHQLVKKLIPLNDKFSAMTLNQIGIEISTYKLLKICDNASVTP